MINQWRGRDLSIVEMVLRARQGYFSAFKYSLLFAVYKIPQMDHDTSAPPMFDSLDVVGTAEKLATDTVLEDRLRYKPFMEVIEKYVSSSTGKPEMVVGGKAATRLLLRQAQKSGGPPPPDAYSMELFSGKAQHHAKQLADLLYAVAPDSLGHYVKVDIYAAEASIAINARDMVKIKLLPIRKGAALADMVIPTNVPAQFITAQIPCMGPEIQLMDTYRALCDPAQADDWADLIRDEKQLRDLFLRGIKAKIKEATGGRAESPAPKADAEFWHAMLEKFVRGTGRVVIGNAASNPAMIAQGHHRVQLVTANRLKEEAEDLQRLAATHSIKISTAINDPSVPIDPRLQRLTGYVLTGDGKREAFINIFGAGQYELIPWVEKAGVRVGTPIVVMRFRLVDIWTIQLLLHIKSITAGYARSVMYDALRDYEKAAEDLDRLLRGEATQTIRGLFPFLQGAIGDGRGFVGHWIDPIVAQKRIAWSARKENPFFHPPYFPAIKNKTGSQSARPPAPSSPPADSDTTLEGDGKE